MFILLLSLQALMAGEIPIETCGAHLGKIGCENPARLAERGLKAYAEELEHGQSVYVVPCTGDSDNAVYVAYALRGEAIHKLKFDQWDDREGFVAQASILSSRLSLQDGVLETEFDHFRSRYEFRGRPDGISLHLLKKTKRHPDGREEILYYKRP